MELLEYESLMRKLKDKRRELGIQQKELAGKADVSAAQLSRMENGRADAKYATVYDVWQELKRYEDEQTDTAADLCTPTIDWVSTNQIAAEAARLLIENDYSQAPVREPDKQRAVGSINTEALLETAGSDQPVSELMTDPFVEVPPSTTKTAIREHLVTQKNAVLVWSDSEYRGIITKFDLI
jgi:Predicted transcriptional regulator with C-terminal CBS domains